MPSDTSQMDQPQLSTSENKGQSETDGSEAGPVKSPEHARNGEEQSKQLKRSSPPDDAFCAPASSKKRLIIKHEDGQVPSSTMSTPSDSDSKTFRSSHGHSSTGHRPVTSCTHCRQHKIKCNASENFPNPCTRCERMGLRCEIDPQFRPKKGSQLQNLRRDVDELKLKIEYLTRNESLISRVLQQDNIGQELANALKSIDVAKVSGMNNFQPQRLQQRPLTKSAMPDEPPTEKNTTKISVQTYLASEPQLLQDSQRSTTATPQDTNSIHSDSSNKHVLPQLLNDSAPANNYKDSLPPVLQMALHRNNSVANSPNGTPGSNHDSPSGSSILGRGYNHTRKDDISDQKRDEDSRKKSPVVATTNAIPLLPSPYASIDEFVIGDVRISIEKANHLHDVFVTKYLPYFPILSSNSASELYSQSQLLFWTVMLTACLSDPEPTMYIKLSSLIKQLAIETCWIRTPRSTHISQALLILCNWPLPNQKVLDDCSYRFVGLAKSLSYQLGLHRGEFISEFTRTQTSMPDAEKWRTRTWLGIFFSELCWASILGLPPTAQTDYLIENARMSLDEEDEAHDEADSRRSKSKTTKNPNDNEHKQSSENGGREEGNGLAENIDHNNRGNEDVQSKDKRDKYRLPRRFRLLICLASFQAKLCKVMGSSVASPDGLMEPRDRASSLAILERELELRDRKLNFGADRAVQIYYLYVRLMICCFAFLPDTPTEDQSQYVTEAYICATKIVTLLTNLLEVQQLIELPIYVRHSVTFAALILFKLQLTPLLLNKYLDSARQSIVTVHRLFRNQLTAWATTVENDISRTASVLEKLNFVLITHPTVFVEEEGIICRMRSHLTDSLFYDLVWCIHEARRREMDPGYNREALDKAEAKRKERGRDSPLGSLDRKLQPLPFYNQISKEDFKTIVQTTPGGTTVTKLVPTKTALSHAKKLAQINKGSNGAIMEINGIPLSMLDETGSVNLNNSTIVDIPSQVETNPKKEAVLEKVKKSKTSQLSGSTPTDIAQHSTKSGSPDLFKNSNNNVNINIQEKPSKKASGPLVSRPTLMNDASMQRSNSTPASTPASTPVQLKSYTQGPRSAKANARNYPNSLFVMNNSLSSNLSLNKSFPLPQEPTDSGSCITPAVNQSNPTLRASASDSYSNLNLFLNGNDLPTLNSAESQNGNKTAMSQLSDLNNFFQQQSTGWIEGSSMNDDFLGWFDMNMEPEF